MFFNNAALIRGFRWRPCHQPEVRWSRPTLVLIVLTCCLFLPPTSIAFHAALRPTPSLTTIFCAILHTDRNAVLDVSLPVENFKVWFASVGVSVPHANGQIHRIGHTSRSVACCWQVEGPRSSCFYRGHLTVIAQCLFVLEEGSLSGTCDSFGERPVRV